MPSQAGGISDRAAVAQGEQDAVNAWIPDVEASEARMLAAGVSVSESNRIAALHAHAHAQEERAIAKATLHAEIKQSIADAGIKRTAAKYECSLVTVYHHKHF